MAGVTGTQSGTWSRDDHAGHTHKMTRAPKYVQGMPSFVPIIKEGKLVQHSHSRSKPLSAKGKPDQDPFTWFKGTVLGAMVAVLGFQGFIMAKVSGLQQQSNALEKVVIGMDRNISSKQGLSDYVAILSGVAELNKDTPFYAVAKKYQETIQTLNNDPKALDAMMTQVQSYAKAGETFSKGWLFKLFTLGSKR